MPAWLIWVIIAAVFAAAETASTTLVFVMIAGGAAGGAVTAALGAPVGAQAGVAVAVTALLLVGVRPVARRHLLAGPNERTGSDALVGREAVVLSAVDRDDGRVRLNGNQWSARTVDRSQVLPPGAIVRVVKIDGATAVVELDDAESDVGTT